MAPPLLSAILVSRDRVALALQAVDGLLEQTYRPLELVLGTEQPEAYAAVAARAAAAIPVRVVPLPDDPRYRLGALRNACLDAALGALVAPWDDDDASHPERLARQVAHLERHGALAVVLAEAALRPDPARPARTARFAPRGGVPGSVVHRRTARRYPNLPRREDAVFLDLLRRDGDVRVLRAPEGPLFERRFHGANTWPVEHFARR